MKMKMGTKIVLGAVLAAPVLWVGVSYAEDSVKTTSTDDVKTTSTTEQKQLTPDEQKELKTRLDKRKAELKTKLSAAEQTKIKTKCKSTQGNLSSIGGRIKGIETSRTEVYGGLVSRLSILSNRLQNQKIDNTALQANITELQNKITTFNTDLTTYKQTVTDLQSMDCTTDPTAYKASLDAARAALTKLKDDSKAIHAYVSDTIKPTLQDVRSKLSA
jgi:chromosome segregation ATPase